RPQRIPSLLPYTTLFRSQKENAALIRLIEERQPDLLAGPQMLPTLLLTNALCYLRLGEQENCIADHNADSCLFPIRGGGVHKLQIGRAHVGTPVTSKARM